jgi:hypothetical protein
MDLKIGMRVRLKAADDAPGISGAVEEIGPPEEMRHWKGFAGGDAGELLIRTFRKSFTRCAFVALDECEGSFFIYEWRGRWWTADKMRLEITPEN